MLPKTDGCVFMRACRFSGVHDLCEPGDLLLRLPSQQRTNIHRQDPGVCNLPFLGDDHSVNLVQGFVVLFYEPGNVMNTLGFCRGAHVGHQKPSDGYDVPVSPLC